MKKSLLFATLVVSLSACQKSDDNEDATPAAIEAKFSQDFTLGYRQQALLPAVTQPELTVELTDLQYTFCPKNATCAVPNFVNPTLIITDRQGQMQQIVMPQTQLGVNSTTWIDTTSVRANDSRYLVQYTKWSTATNCDQSKKKDISVMLRVTKPIGN